MTYYFFDTSAFIAQSQVDDKYHKQALKIAEKLEKEGAIGCTTDFVLSETLTFLRYNIGHRSALEFHQAIKTGSNLIVVYTIQEDFKQGMKIFEQYQDKDFSVVDCISFVIMRKRNITHAFTFNKQFEQAGFEIIKPN